jgi:formate hydrogenlyase transcriptional activator
MTRAGTNREKLHTPSEDVRKREEALRKSEERWRSVFENSAIGVALTDLNGRFLATNPVYQKMLGYTEEELRELSFLDVTHEDYRESNWALATELLEGKREQFQIEKRYRRKDGRLIWVRNNVSLVPGTETVPKFIMALSEDVTERKEAEEALREAEEFKSRLIACSQDCIKVLDLEGRLLSMNEGGMQALEICDLAQAVNSCWIDFWEGDDREGAQAAVEAARNGRTGRFTGYFATTVTKQPRWWDVLVSPIRDAEGKPERLLAVSRDVTKHKQDEQALSETQLQIARSEERVRLILDSAAEGIFGCDPEGTCLFCNRAAVRLLGYDDPAELLGKNMHALEHHTHADGTPYPIEECPIYVGFQNGQGVHRDDEVYWRKDGTSFPVEFWSHPIMRDGRTIGAVITYVDITERKRAEQALRKSDERNRSLLEINNAIMTNLSQEALLRSISEALRRILSFDRAALTLYLPQKDVFRFMAIEGNLVSDYFYPGLEIDPKGNSVGWVFNQQRPIVRYDLEKEQQYANERRLAAEGMRSHCVVPLIVRGESIGTLNVASSAKNQYSEADAELLQEVANQVALAVANMQTYEEIASLNAKVELTAERLRTLLEINNAIITNLTEEALFASAYEAIRRVISFDRAAFLLYRPETKTLQLVSMDSDAESDFFQVGKEYDLKETRISAWVIDQQQSVLRGDLEKEQQSPGDQRLVAEGIQSYCVVPLVAMGSSIGTFTVWSETKNRYSKEDAELLREVANQVALAIANMKSYEEIATLKARLEKENVYLQEEIRTEHNFEEIVGSSPALLDLLRRVDQVAPTDSSVLIYGETGTGKELIARAIHDRSARKNRPLVKVNCSAISAGLVESELFGHVKGAFTGAFERRIGRFELADGGTLFLDEVGELPLETQVKLLRVLQEREFEPVGSNRSVHVDVRVIAATNRNLEESIRNGSFRSDLYYRLNVFPLKVPPLRERRSDIRQLAMFFLSRYSRNLGKKIEGISQDAADRLVNYAWPGNVRELQNVIERALILCRGTILELDTELTSLSSSEVLRDTSQQAADVAQPTEPKSPPLPTLEEVERAHISAVLQQTRGVIEGAHGAAKTLGMHPNTLRHRMEKLGIKRSAHRIS